MLFAVARALDLSQAGQSYFTIFQNRLQLLASSSMFVQVKGALHFLIIELTLFQFALYGDHHVPS